MNRHTRKERIENTLQAFFSPKLLVVRDDSKKHEGHNQISKNEMGNTKLSTNTYIIHMCI